MLVQCLRGFSNLGLPLKHPFEALHYLQGALSILQAVRDRHGLAEALDLLGVTSWLSGALLQSAAYYRQTVELFREMDNRQGLVSRLASLLLCGGAHQAAPLVSVATSVTGV